MSKTALTKDQFDKLVKSYATRRDAMRNDGTHSGGKAYRNAYADALDTVVQQAESLRDWTVGGGLTFLGLDFLKSFFLGERDRAHAADNTAGADAYDWVQIMIWTAEDEETD